MLIICSARLVFPSRSPQGNLINKLISGKSDPALDLERFCQEKGECAAMSPDWVACPYGAASFLMKTDATKLSLALDWLKSSNNERSTKTLLHILHTPTATDPNVNCGESLNLTLKGYQELLRTSLSLHVKLSVCLHFINLSCQVMSAWILVQVRVGGA